MREKLIELLKACCYVGKDCNMDCNVCTADYLIANGVTVQKKGEWIHDIYNSYGCSECGERETMSHRNLKNFCPNCGADMTKGGAEHER